MKKTRNGMRITGLLLTMVMLVALLGAFSMTASAAEGTAIDLSSLTGTYVISDSGEYTFTGSGSYCIKVESGNPTIVLNNASITVGEGSAIDIASGSTTTIFVMGDNTIDTDSMWETAGGIFVAEGGTVNITSNGTDNILRAHGTLAAAIGGKYDYDNNESYNAGSISISNVTVYAYTNNFHAAAIGAAGEGTCGTINITNAVVYAYGAGDRWTSAPGIGSAWSLVSWSETIPVVIISDSEVHTFRYNPYSDYIGYLGDEMGEEGGFYATGSINCGEGGLVKSSTIYCYTGLDAITTDKTVKYGALGGLLKEDGTCEGEHSGGTQTCMGYKCANCANWYGEKNDTHDWSGKVGICANGCGMTCDHSNATYPADGITDTQHKLVCSECGYEVTETHDFVDGECVCGVKNFHIYGQQLNVGGDLSMKYYVTAFGDGVSTETLKMKFIFLGKETFVSGIYNAEMGMYVFTLEGINPQCMGDKIDAYLLLNGEEKASKLFYTVEENLLALRKEYEEDEALVTLVNDILAYGTAASEYKNHNSMTDVYVGSDREIRETEWPALDIGFEGYTVVFRQVNYLKIKVNLAEGQTLYLDGVNVTAKVVDGIFKTDGIAPTNFDKKFNFEIRTDGVLFNAFSVSVNDYLSAKRESETMGKLVKALYNYGVSAEIYNHIKTGEGEHNFVDGVCACGELQTIDATEMTAEQLNAAVAELLASGVADITIKMSADADEEMFTALRTAFAESTAPDGSINLTISGAKTVPDEGFIDMLDYFENEDKNIAGDKLKSLTLTDVETIGEYAFSACTNLEAVNMPKVITIGEYAFNEWKKGTKLTSLDLPNATTIGDCAFAYSSLLTSVNLPKVVTIGLQAFERCDIRILDLPEVTEIGGMAFVDNYNLVSCSAPKATTIGAYPWGNCSKLETLELTAAGDITISNNYFANTLTWQINLVLNKGKESQVTQNDDGTATWNIKDGYGNFYTFKSITFACSDGTTNHDYQYTDNGDGTHDEVCSKCDYVKVDNEKHTAVPDGYDCICGATVIAVIDGTLGGKTTATEDDVNALVEQLKAYVDNGITTIIVTGEEPAIIFTEDNVYMPAVPEALYRLAGRGHYDESNPYYGTIDLIMSDITAVAEWEFLDSNVLNTIYLPKVTTVDNAAFAGCYYLKKITFGSVVNFINQDNRVVFYQLGSKVGGCDLVLNCGQMQAEDTYKPDLENNVWFKPSWGGDVTWNSITLTHTGECDECKANH